MQEVPYKIYSASAGSGKTYVLSKEYIKTVLSSTHSFKQILAITFTNKAVNEMKHRIIDSLFEFSKTTSKAEASSMFLDIMKELHFDATSLQKKSKRTLKEILHNYAFFDISTIDKFTHRLIRTFAKDLKLPQNFEVVLDNNLLLDEAVSALINKAGTNDKLTQVLLDFALEKIDDDKSWDIAIDLNKIGKLLFNENHVPHLKQISDKGLDAFLDLKKALKIELKAIEQNAGNLATKTLELIKDKGFEYSDFPRETLPNHFKKIIEGVYEPSKIYNNKLEQNLIDNKIVKANITISTEDLSPQLLHYYSTIKTLLYHRSFLKNVYQNLVPLTVLNAIQHEVKSIQKEKDQLSISEFNTIISNEIKNQPAPFIYERLGEKYRHYFIDEFQDTSEMQWNNLTPLISNALESENLLGQTGSLFLVGDVKQSIYRWRGGKAEQFLNLVNKETNPFVIAPAINNLPDNYRSHEEVISFNNEFFTCSSSLLNNSTYKDLYIQGNNQGTNNKKGGVVSLSFLEKENSTDEDYCTEVLKTINQVRAHNYSYKDICIITRKRKQGVVIADFLMQNKVPIISSESLLLKNSPKVKFLVHLLRYSLLPNDLENNYQILHYLASNNANKHTFIADNLKQLDQLLSNIYNYNRKLIEQLSVFDTIEYAIKQFKLADSSNAYITYFLDIALEVEQNNGADLQTFLNYWDKKEDNLSISAPETMNAVQIMTVHKAKGLEFKIVIFPFANSSFKEQIDPKLWLPINSEISPNFKEFLISKKQEVIHYGKTAEVLYNDEEYKLELDAFNVIYVALTRAVKGLYVITKKDLTSKGEHKETTYSGMFIAFLKHKNIWNREQSIFTFGTLDTNSQKTINHKNQTDIIYKYSEKDRPGFSIITKSGMLWDTDREQAINKGNILHNVLSNIYTEKNIHHALSKALSSGEINTKDVSHLKTKIKNIINHPDLHAYYTDSVTIYNEKDIITSKGEVLRPDRIVLQNNTATIIDYKTGKRDNRYYEQLFSYADALTSMGYSVQNKIIVYINDQISTEFI